MHYGEKFIERYHLRYIDGKLGCYYKFDKSHVSYFEIECIVENFGYVKGDQLFYLLPYRPIQVGVRPTWDDEDYIQMLAFHEVDWYLCIVNSIYESKSSRTSSITQNPNVTDKNRHTIEGLSDNDANNE